MIRFKHMAVAVLALTVVACGRRAPSPSDPTVVINRFMEAVNAENYQLMGQLWGSEDGPAVNWMEPDELRKRLTVMQGFLEHKAVEIMPGAPAPSSDGRLMTDAYRFE